MQTNKIVTEKFISLTAVIRNAIEKRFGSSLQILNLSVILLGFRVLYEQNHAQKYQEQFEKIKQISDISEFGLWWSALGSHLDKDDFLNLMTSYINEHLISNKTLTDEPVNKYLDLMKTAFMAATAINLDELKKSNFPTIYYSIADDFDSNLFRDLNFSRLVTAFTTADENCHSILDMNTSLGHKSAFLDRQPELSCNFAYTSDALLVTASLELLAQKNLSLNKLVERNNLPMPFDNNYTLFKFDLIFGDIGHLAKFTPTVNQDQKKYNFNSGSFSWMQQNFESPYMAHYIATLLADNGIAYILANSNSFINYIIEYGITHNLIDAILDISNDIGHLRSVARYLIIYRKNKADRLIYLLDCSSFYLKSGRTAYLGDSQINQIRELVNKHELSSDSSTINYDELLELPNNEFSIKNFLTKSAKNSSSDLMPEIQLKRRETKQLEMELETLINNYEK